MPDRDSPAGSSVGEADGDRACDSEPVPLGVKLREELRRRELEAEGAFEGPPDAVRLAVTLALDVTELERVPESLKVDRIEGVGDGDGDGLTLPVSLCDGERVPVRLPDCDAVTVLVAERVPVPVRLGERDAV